MRKPGVLSATIPDGQQRSGSLLIRSGGQQIDRVRGRTPMFPRRIGTLHLCCGGQHALPLAVLQHERLLGQHPAVPQQRVVRRLQHLRSHASSSSRQRLQRPVDGFAQRRFRGQHLFGPHRARPWGHCGTHLRSDPIRRHSSFVLQQRRPQMGSPCLQQSSRVGIGAVLPVRTAPPAAALSGRWTPFAAGAALPARQDRIRISSVVITADAVRDVGQDVGSQGIGGWAVGTTRVDPGPIAVERRAAAFLGTRAARTLGLRPRRSYAPDGNSRDRQGQHPDRRSAGHGPRSERASSSRSSLTV